MICAPEFIQYLHDTYIQKCMYQQYHADKVTKVINDTWDSFLNNSFRHFRNTGNNIDWSLSFWLNSDFFSFK